MKKIYALLLAVFCTGVMFANLHEGVPDEKGFVSELKVYPNPSSTGKYALRFTTEEKQTEITIKVFNLIGGEVYRKKITAHQGVYQGYINIHSFPKGMYMLEISNGEHKHTRRLSFI
ncbi:MAG: T9SS C-terminal target domain-containing protein [Bacteroidetes bacterium]|nr:MAG: T9SS C-terminal target domain-containing protein [Bacteroidota bacterium]